MNCCVKVRPVERRELGQVYAIERESFDQPYSLWYLELLLSLSGGEYFLVSVANDDSITGYIVAVPIGENVCHIASIAVKKACRRQRVATCLLQSLFELCIEDGRRIFVLEVEHTNMPALRLYRTNCFHPLRVIPNYYGPGRHALVMLRYEAYSLAL
ncbi:GNAT family N-acetyltransferase [Hyperthermus butylicus]|uniref:Acetyltransferase n=1 Tax=Hyperthermus butylicus (strain DSM 5456 / JCM 9403 / PLM1-5) TaxID=415426 RepID=A2BL83_HYPBU|nr:N-acetyltransferase [Hyperthermus butylicus]ABM80744.1 putative acetyltransferase [Hyperthermus butylicus DSM 5456]